MTLTVFAIHTLRGFVVSVCSADAGRWMCELPGVFLG